MSRMALLVIDVQNDFLTGGALAVPKAEAVIDRANLLIDAFVELDLPVFFTRDWHPSDHASFASAGGLWPEHCVGGSRGAQFPDSLHVPPAAEIVDKGTASEIEGYSAFDGTDLERRLIQAQVESVAITGLAIEYCVRQTALGALDRGYQAFVIEDAVQGLSLHPADTHAVLTDLERQGAKVLTSETLLKALAIRQAG